ncbi:hypothetical protein K4K53_011058 [Colletotrichum sp. SAR 10_77]|nr:hypothetical protein K4K53_011058 [Colletotrichum sp. SAR 10_77]
MARSDTGDLTFVIDETRWSARVTARAAERMEATATATAGEDAESPRQTAFGSGDPRVTEWVAGPVATATEVAAEAAALITPAPGPAAVDKLISLLEEHLEGLFELVHLPPDMISLTYPAGEYTLYGPQWWLVDCKSGRIVKYAGPPRGEALAEEFETEWKKAPSYSPSEFFAEVTTMFGKDYYPIPGLVDGIAPDFSTPDRREIASSMYQTFMLAGWQPGRGPGPAFDREKCRKDLEAFLKDRQERESRKRKAEASRHESRPPPRERRDPTTYPAGYDRDVIVAGLTKYYETLAQMAFFPASLIQYPPGGHWDNDTFLPADKTRLLGFNNRVIDLLRHLPYLDVDETHEDNRWPVIGRSQPQRYLEDNPELNENLTADKATPERLCAHGLFPFAEKMPDGLVPIAGGGGEGSDSGEWWIIDTNAGNVIVYDVGNKQVQDAPNDQPWLWTPPRPAGLFFEALVDSLHSLDLVPLPRPDTEDAEYYPEVWGAIREGKEGEDEVADSGIEYGLEIEIEGEKATEHANIMENI